MNCDFKQTTASALSDLGPRSDVVEGDRETLLKMFIELDEQHTSSFTKTQPSALLRLRKDRRQPPGRYSVQDVMAEARRHNRVCPREAEWQHLHVMLGQEAPASLSGGELKRTPPLLRRIRLRDQVEWAAEKGQLLDVMDFLQRLREDQWMHMGS